MKLKLLFILLLFAGVNLTLCSQSIDWAMSSNSSSVDIFYDTVVNEDNGQIFTVGLVSEEASNGFLSTENATQSEITDASDFQGGWEGILVSTDLDGTPLWNVTLSSSNDDAMTGVDVMPNGDVIVTGYFEHNNATIHATNGDFPINQLDGDEESDAFYARFNSEGELIDSRAFGTYKNEIGIDIKASDDCFYVLVESDVDSNGDASKFLLKVNDQNDIEWQANVHHTDYFTVDYSLSEAACLSVENGSVFVFGTYRGSTFSYTDGQGVLHAYPWSFDTYQLDFFVLALNEDGSEKWAQEIEQGSDVTSGYGMDSDCNGLYLTGSGHASFFNPMIFPGGLYFNNFDHDDIWACGLNLETGEANWIKAFNTYGANHADIGFGVSTDGKGNVYITGVHESTIYVDGLELEHGEDQDLFVAAMNGSGEVNWMIGIQSDDNDLGCALDAYASDKLVIAGLGGSDLSFGGNTLSENSDNALLMSLTVPENNGFLCCDLTEITLSAQHTSVCNGEPVRLNSSEFYPGLVVQSNSGFGWTDLLSLSQDEAVIYPTQTKTYRLAYFGDGCSFTSNEVSISVSEAEGIGPGGPRCGLKLWLRADTLVNSIDGIGVLDGDTIEYWNDLGINSFSAYPKDANNAYQAELAPTWKENAQNFYPSLVFSGNQNVIIPQKVFSAEGGELTTYMIARPNGEDLNSKGVLYDFGRSPDAGIGIELDQNSAGYYADQIEPISVDLNLANKAYLVKNRFSPNENALMILNEDTVINTTPWNGEVIGEDFLFEAEMNSDPSDGGPFTIGMKSSEFDSDHSFIGEIYEVLAFQGSLSELEQQKIESYLNLKYSLINETTVLQNFLNSNGDVIYEAEGAYQDFSNEIAGIGRDNASDFLQRKARGQGDIVVMGYDPGLPTDDLSFVVWGNNGEDYLFEQSTQGIANSRMNKVWRVQESGESLSLKIYVAQAESLGVTHLVAHSTDPNITSPEKMVCLQNEGSRRYAIVDLEDGEYFSFASLPMVLSSDITDAACSLNNGAIEVIASGGFGNYSYSWSPGAIAGAGTNSVNSLFAGEYTLTVSDDSGCSMIETYTVGSVSNLTIDQVDTTDESCNGDSNGSIALNISGGIGEVSVNWLEGLSGATISSLPPGEYNYEVTDEASCALNGSVVVNSTAAISLDNIMQTNVDCIENAIGSFSATVAGGNGPYSIELEQITESFNLLFIPTSNTVSDVLGDFSFADLSAGEYNLIITDANGCESDLQFEITSLDVDPPFFECPNDQIENTGSTCTFTLPDYFVGIGVADDCAVIRTQSPLPSTPLSAGVHTIYLRASDASGNDYSCDFQLTVLDVQNPLIVAPVEPFTLEVDQNCEVTVPDYTTIITATDNCGISTLSQAPSPGTIQDSDFTLIISVSDFNGNSGLMNFNVELVDSTSPTYTESVPTEFPIGVDCYYELEDLTTFVSGSDNCSSVSISQNPAVGTELGAGSHTIDFSVQDANGNQVDFSKTILVEDQESPTGAVDAPFVFEINDGCQWVVEDLTVNVIANDNCGVEVINQTPAVGELLDIGLSMMEFEVIDEAGNVLSLQQEISIQDSSAPTLLQNSAPTSLAANEDCEWIVTDLTGFVEGIDNCSDVTVVQIPLPGTVLEIGDHTIEFYLFDASTNSIQVIHNIEVKYNLSPDLIVSTPFEFNVGDACVYELEDLLPTVSTNQNCSNHSIVQSPSPGELLGLGLHVITFTVTDEFDNSLAVEHTIEVVDTQAPSINCLTELIVDAEENCSGVMPEFTFADFNANDNCSLGSISQDIPPGTLISSSTIVEVEISDSEGNSVDCAVDVRTADTSPPVINCESYSIQLINSCDYLMPDLSLENWYSDNCEIDFIEQSIALGSALGVGTHAVEVRATDHAGLTSVCNLEIVIEDNSGPEVICPDAFTLEAPSSECGILAGDLISICNVTSSSCDLLSLEQDVAADFFLDVNVHNVIFTARDANNNSTQCSTSIQVVDNTLPIIDCPASILLSENPDCSYQLPDLISLPEIVVEESCPFNIDQSIPSGNTINENTDVVITVRDDSDNQASCVVSIVLTDSQAPLVLSETNVTVEVGESCSYVLSNWDDIIEISDCNSNITIAGSATLGQSFEIGSHALELIITDQALNETPFDLTLDVRDTQAPVVVCPNAVLEVEMNDDCSLQTPLWEDELSIDDNCASDISVINVEDFGGQLYNFDLEISDGTNSSFCSVMVQGLDVTPPVISVCPADQTPDFDEQCQYALLDYTNSLEVTDSCTPLEDLVITQDPPAGTLITGETQVTILVVDNSLLSASCSFNVSPIDQSPPIISSCAEDQVISAVDCTVLIPDYTSELVAEDNCTYTIEQLPAPGTSLVIGDHPVIFKVSDGVNDEVSCEMTVSVIDDLSPIVTDISLDQYPSNSECQYQLEGWESYIQISDCSDFEVNMVPEEGTFFNSGDQEVVFTVSDGINLPTNIAIQFGITEDFSWTLIDCPSNSELSLNTSCQAVLPDFTSLIETSVTCGTVLEIIQTPAPGTLVEGEQEIQVQIAISGNNGEEENCSFTVSVEDDTIPVLNCENFTLSQATCVAIMPNISEFNWAEDLCTEVSYSQSIAQGTELEVGQHFLSIQAFGGGNAPATCEVTVTVEDNTAPLIDCSSNEPILVSSGCTYEVEDFRNLISVEDNCLESVSIEQRFEGESESNIGQLVSPGDYTIEFVVFDGLHSTACSRMLVVESNAVPTLTCAENISVALVDGENCSKVIEYELPEVLNSCGAEELVQTAGLPSGAEFPIGITVNSFDLLLNGQPIATCSFEVELIDEVLPSIVCPESIVSCDPVVFYDMPQAFDNCDGVTVEQMSQLDFSSGSTFPLGITSILFKAVDAQGNWVTCELVIEIIASETPVWEALEATYCVDQPSIDLNEMVDFSGTVSWSENTSNGVLNLNELGAGIHEITLETDQNSCSSELSQTIEILALPTLDIITQEEVCGMQLILEVEGAATSYNWTIPDGVISASSSSNQTQDVLADEQGSYVFQVTGDLSGCQATSEVSIQFWDQPGIPDAGLDQQLNGSATALNGSYDGIGEIYWESNSDEVIIQEPNQTNTEVLNVPVGWNDFVLYQTNGNCPANSDTVRIHVLKLEIPTGFSPNGDNVNDVFYVNGLEQFSNVQLLVFNRWGNEVYKNNDYKNEWDGSNNNGNLLEEDTYYVVLTLDDEEYKGYVVIKK